MNSDETDTHRKTTQYNTTNILNTLKNIGVFRTSAKKNISLKEVLFVISIPLNGFYASL